MTGSPRLSSAPSQQPSLLSRTTEVVKGSNIGKAARAAAVAALAIIAACADSGTTEPTPEPTPTTSNATPTVPAGKSRRYSTQYQCEHISAPECPDYKQKVFNATACDLNHDRNIDDGEVVCLQQ